MKGQIEKLLEEYGLKSTQQGRSALQRFVNEYGTRLVKKIKEANTIFPKMGASQIRLVYEKDKGIKSHFVQDVTIEREEETIQILNGLYLSQKDLEKEEKQRKDPSEVLTVHLPEVPNRATMTKKNQQIGINRKWSDASEK